MTIEQDVIESLAKLNIKFIGKSHCWNIYRAKLGKQSIVNKACDKIFNSTDCTEITVVVGAIGWTGHSKTELLMFDSSKKTALFGTAEACYRDFFTFVPGRE